VVEPARTRREERGVRGERRAPPRAVRPPLPAAPGAAGAAPRSGRPGARLVAAVWAAKAAAAASRALGRGGTALPGLVAERIEPAVVARLARRLGGGRAVVTGTNGKTTTARMLAAMLRTAGTPVLHNRSGSNLMRGLAATLADAAALDATIPRAAATAGVFEVDEATVPHATAAVRPDVLVVTNLFRDQLDRYGEVDSIAALWRRAVAGLPAAAVLVLNADDPSVAALRHAAPCRVLSYGVEDVPAGTAGEAHPADARWCAACGTEFAYPARFFWHVGHWACPGCGDRRPRPDIAAVAVAPAPGGTRLRLATPAGPLAVTLALAGLYNVYNALAAAAAALALGVPPAAVGAALARFAAAFGRQERFPVAGREARVLLCKNPAGVNQVLGTVLADPRPLHLLLVLNDGIADGRDVSWIWDVDFERLAGRTAALTASGTRAADLALRLAYAGLGDRLEVVEEPRAAADRALARTPAGGTLYVLPTYTAMLAVREHLARRAGRGRFWQQ
jgi:UDP-N-acetylmuramyl tripeptide synthase